MQIYTNQVYVRRRSNVGKWGTLSGLGILLAGFFISLQRPEWTSVAGLCLLAGFIASIIGSQYLARFTRPDRPDVVLGNALKGVDNRYVLYNYLIPKIPHLLLEPGGLSVLALSHTDGKIHFDGKKWHRPWNLGRLIRWMGDVPLGDPLKEAGQMAQAVAEWIEKALPELDVPVRGVVVFTHVQANLTLDDEDAPVMTYKQIKTWLRKTGKQTALPKETLAQLQAFLAQAANLHPE